MADLRLLYVDGSPFSRVVRILLRDWGIACAEEELPFPLPADHFTDNPLGQVPVLIDGDARLFPTFLILEHLAEAAGQGFDRQQALILLAAGDAIAAARYQDWAGLGRTGPDRLGFDPGQRNVQRFLRMLDWAETQTLDQVGQTVIAVFILWTESRGPVTWRGHPHLVALVDRLAATDAFVTTAPRPWG